MKAVEKRFSSQPDRTAWVTVQGIAQRRLDQMERLETRVLRGEKAEALHDFRVASRRAEQALDLLIAPHAPARVRRLRRQLARARRSISAVRNYDVMLYRAELEIERNKRRRREAWVAVRDYFREKRPRKHAKAAKKLEKLKLKRTYARLRVRLESPAMPAARPSRIGRNGPPAVANALFSERVSAELRRAWKRLEDAGAKAASSSSVSAVHALRLAVKRLRYLLEITQEREEPSSAQALRMLRKSQQRLGEWHDREMEGRLLAKMLARPKFLRRHAPLAREVLALIEHQHSAKERAAARDSLLLSPAELGRLNACMHDLLKRRGGDSRRDA